jgi:hypothetical protein
MKVYKMVIDEENSAIWVNSIVPPIKVPITRILGSFRFNFALTFIDDIVIFSKSFDDHLTHVELVLDAFLNAGMTLDEAKCHFVIKALNL